MSELKHYGVLGMKWGRRKDYEDLGSTSSDHDIVAAIKKKPLRDITDREVTIAVNRMRMVRELKNAYPTRSFERFGLNNSIKKMSNEQLAAAITRQKLKKETESVWVRRNKPVALMSDEEVVKTYKRHLLEKPYRELIKEDQAGAIKFTKALLVIVGRVLRAYSGMPGSSRRSSSPVDDYVNGQWYDATPMLPPGASQLTSGKG